MKKKLLWNVLIIIVAVGTGLALSMRPRGIASQEDKKNLNAAQDMKKVESEINELRRKKAEAESPVGREKIARDHGLLRNGEKPVEIGR